MNMRTWLNRLLVLGTLALPFSSPAAVDQPLPPLDEIIERALERAEAEAENERLFNQNYHYVRSRQTEIRNADGDVKKLKSKISTNAPSGPLADAEDGRSLDDIDTIVWATGLRADHCWLDRSLVDRHGVALHDGGVGHVPGLYTMGLPFMRRRKSVFIDGAGADAPVIAARVAARVGALSDTL
jgi:hypothetical protein